MTGGAGGCDESRREQPNWLAEQQAALRRVATLVAQGASPETVFAAVADELARVLHVLNAGLLRYESDGSGVVVAVGYQPGITQMPVTGDRIPLSGDDVGAQILRTGLPTRIDSHENVNGPEAERIRAAGIGSIVGVPVIVDGHLWGAAIVGSKGPDALPQDTEERIGDFADLLATAIVNAAGNVELQASRDSLEVLVSQQAALRRVATLVAREVEPTQIFDVVTDEMRHCLRVGVVGLWRLETSDEITLVGSSTGPEALAGWPVGTRSTVEGNNLVSQVLATGQPARMDSYADAEGVIAERARRVGLSTAVGVPVVVGSRIWGMAAVGLVTPGSLPADTEARMSDFAELVATSIANAATRDELQTSRDNLQVLADQQAALRRVATLVASGVGPSEVFTAVAEEAARCLQVGHATVYRYEGVNTLIPLAVCHEHQLETLPEGLRLSLTADNIAETVLRTGRTARMDRDDDAPRPHAGRFRGLGMHSAAGAPIVVDGHVWGAALVGSTRAEPLPPHAEQRVAEFTDLIATAIAAATAHADLIASRARIVTTADEARRRLERDLHDGAQQSLVSLALQVRAAEASLPPELNDQRRTYSDIVHALNDILRDLQELSRGIHPAILSKGGLRPALKALARRSMLPVSLDVNIDRRFPEPVELASYYAVAEALTNAAKHSQASAVAVSARSDDGDLYLCVSDDGIGGADVRTGSGLVGLHDRVEALGGTIQLTSDVGAGTSLDIRIPVDGP
jgi:signal transduction histidine kinase